VENIEDSLKTYRAAIDRAKEDRTKAKTTKENLEAQEKQIIEELKVQSVDDPAKLDKEIQDLNTAIEDGRAKLDELIPKEYLGV